MEQRSLDDALIKRYLLGDTSPEEQEQLEQRLLIDEEFIEQLSMTRTDMVDDYVFANLSAKEREQFEKYFLSTPEHRQMLKTAGALASRFEEVGRNIAATVSASSQAPVPYYVRHLNAIISLTAGLILLGTTYVVWELVKQRQANDQANEAQAQRANFENELVKLNRPTTGSAPDTHPVVSLDLKPIVVRDVEEKENRSVVISRTPSILRLRLGLPVDKYHSYQASLQTDQGVDLAAIDGLQKATENNEKVVVLDLPTWLMRAGSYQIKLSGVLASGQAEEVTQYPFEITNQ
jgi:hypothetical protein